MYVAARFPSRSDDKTVRYIVPRCRTAIPLDRNIARFPAATTAAAATRNPLISLNRPKTPRFNSILYSWFTRARATKQRGRPEETVRFATVNYYYFHCVGASA